MKAVLTKWAQHLEPRMPLILLVFACAFAIFFGGYLVGDRHYPPYGVLKDAQTAFAVLKTQLKSSRIRSVVNETKISVAEGMKQRVMSLVPVDDDNSFLLTGGEGQYLEYCPGDGCAAVIVKRDGTLVHAYPNRPDELVTKRTMELHYSELLHDDAKDTAILGLDVLPGGDLIAIYDYEGAVPQGGGIARLDRNGHVVWYRRDYSNHWPRVLPHRGEILNIRFDQGPKRVTLDIQGDQKVTLACDRGIHEDAIQILDFNGQVKDEVPIFAALAASPYRSFLLVSNDVPYGGPVPCNALHPNSVNEVGAELAAKFPGVNPDDFLVSLRNISSIIILGRKDHRVKRLFNSTFLFQHSAQVAPGGKIVMWDNLGATDDVGPSRVLELDPATGTERTLLNSRQAAGLFSKVMGNINISPDGTRALVAPTESGKGYEIRLSDGAILTTFDNLHDVHVLPKFAGLNKMVRFCQYGIYYVSSHLLDAVP